MAVFERLFETDGRFIQTVFVDGADGAERVNKCADGVEVHVGRQCRLVKRSDGTGPRLTQRLVDLVDEFLEETQATHWIAGANVRLTASVCLRVACSSVTVRFSQDISQRPASIAIDYLSSLVTAACLSMSI